MQRLVARLFSDEGQNRLDVIIDKVFRIIWELRFYIGLIEEGLCRQVGGRILPEQGLTVYTLSTSFDPRRFHVMSGWRSLLTGCFGEVASAAYNQPHLVTD